jgi:murein DD-endopeptidase MepM/ murein hydrolase activator NlpD
VRDTTNALQYRYERVTAARSFVRAAVAAAVLVPLLGLAGAGTAAAADVPPRCGVEVSCPPICFPVEGPSAYNGASVPLGTTYWSDTFGAPRSGHAHEGQDIMSTRGVKMRHLIAAASGTIVATKTDNSGNYIVIKADDTGWFYVYIHVNNDSPGTDDGRATLSQILAPGISQGVHVTQGQFIGYLGDSGNAENAGAHNHFEVRQPSANTASWAWSSAPPVNSTSILVDAMAHPERCGPSRFAPFTGVAELVDRQYRDFLGRAPDAGGRNSWSDAIHSDAQTPASFILNMIGSQEFASRIAPIARLYKAYFLRTPDTSGLQFWVDQYRNGRSLAWISDSFAQSNEFTSRYGALGNADFVEQVYLNVLGRASEAGGKEFWTGKLDRGELNRGQVMLGFSESPENIDVTDDWVQVVLTYVGMLDRAPDAGGLEFWMGYDDRTALVDGFLHSDEYAGRIAALRG